MAGFPSSFSGWTVFRYCLSCSYLSACVSLISHISSSPLVLTFRWFSHLGYFELWQNKPEKCSYLPDADFISFGYVLRIAASSGSPTFRFFWGIPTGFHTGLVIHIPARMCKDSLFFDYCLSMQRLFNLMNCICLFLLLLFVLLASYTKASQQLCPGAYPQVFF